MINWVPSAASLFPRYDQPTDGDAELVGPQVNSVLFSDEDTGAKQGPALQSRTRDGLNVRLEARGTTAKLCWSMMGELIDGLMVD